MPVVSLSGLDMMIEAGANVELEAKKNAESKSPNWIGEWYIYGVEQGTGERFMLVQGVSLVPKAIKTANSVVHHCHRLGFKTAKVPLLAGDTVLLTDKDRAKV